MPPADPTTFLAACIDAWRENLEDPDEDCNGADMVGWVFNHFFPMALAITNRPEDAALRQLWPLAD